MLEIELLKEPRWATPDEELRCFLNKVDSSVSLATQIAELPYISPFFSSSQSSFSCALNDAKIQ